MKLLATLFIIIMKLIEILNITYIISCEWHVNICKHDMLCALEMNSIGRQVWEILLSNHLRHYIFTTTTPMATKIWQSGDLPWGTHTRKSWVFDHVVLRDHFSSTSTTTYAQQTWYGNYLLWEVSMHKVRWLFIQLVLQDQMAN